MRRATTRLRDGRPPTPLADLSAADFDTAVEVSLRGVFLCLKYEIPAMLQVGGGAIVNMASTAGLEAVGEQMQRRAGAAMPVRRIGKPDEVAAAVVWLCSSATSYITGVVLPVDGGKLAGSPPFAVAGGQRGR